MYETDLTDSQWQIMQNALPITRRHKYALRLIVNTLLYLTKSGCQWRLLPNDFPPYPICLYYFFCCAPARTRWVKGHASTARRRIRRCFSGRGLFFGAVFFCLARPVGVARNAARHPVAGENLVGVCGQALGQLRPVAHGQQVPGGQRLVQYVEQRTRQPADPGLRHAKASGGLVMQRIGFAVVQQEKSFVSVPDKVASARSWCAGIHRRAP